MSKDDTPGFVAACAQFDVRRGDVGKNLASAESALRVAAEDGAQLVVLPEMWTTSFVKETTTELIQEARAAEQTIAQVSKELGLMVIGGGLEEDQGAFFNRCVVVDSGNILGTYRKIHLFSPNAEHRYLQAGEAPLILDTRLGKLGVMICYDIRFPELVRYHFHMGVEVLVVPAQWPEARSDHWRTLVKARAIENQMFILGCNRTGIEESLRNNDNLTFPGDSRIVDPMGQVLARGNGEDAPVTAEINLKRVRTMRRILPVHRDRQGTVYRTLWEPILTAPQPAGPQR
ncbi:MAG: nitrilase-related carbon-nitrogen hydrolase [Planctomycetota bacterium]